MTAEKNDNPWNQDVPFDHNSTWLAAKTYLDILNERLTGSKDTHWFNWSIEHYVNVGDTRGKSCLILGSNEGWMEIALRQSGFEGRIVASDIADRALARARARVKELNLSGIEHLRANLNSESFPEDGFDYIIAEGVLHHVENLEFCLKGLRAALKPGGRLVGVEFVGAFRFQFPEIQVRWINMALDCVPRKYRPWVGDGDPNFPRDENERLKASYVPMTVPEMIAMDPSEAISGHILLPTLKKYFTVELLREGGGALVMNMVGHFPFGDTNTDPDCCEWLKVIANIEYVLYKQNIVPSDLVFFVCA